MAGHVVQTEDWIVLQAVENHPADELRRTDAAAVDRLLEKRAMVLLPDGFVVPPHYQLTDLGVKLRDLGPGVWPDGEG